MRECYKLNPEARIETCLATYTSSANFESTHGMTRYGGRRMRYSMGKLTDCDCDD